MRSNKPTGFRLSSIVTSLTIIILVIYCVYILPIAFQSGSTQPDTDFEHGKHEILQHIEDISNNLLNHDVKLDINVIEDKSQSQSPIETVSASTKIASNPAIPPDFNIPSFPAPLTFATSNALDHKAVLVVGGTDGSGTRRVVQILTQLGVIMVSEDPETYDIHADLVKGWPEVVSPVVAATRSLDYKPKALAKTLQERTRSKVASILGQVEKDSIKPTSYKLAVGGVLPHPEGVTARSVLYGFKAPVAMTLIPWFADLSPHFKVIHVLRDGRDIAFSANQGPVSKFYAANYGSNDPQVPAPVKGIKLWSDWNSQVYKWSDRYAQELRDIQSNSHSDSDRSFGYFAVHSEDLVSPSAVVRYAAIRHLADFVGSSLSSQQLCCLALQEAAFMGSHDRTPINKKAQSANTVTKRYGKWHALLAKDAGLSERIHTEGAEGLRVFGYEPERHLAEDSMRGPDGESCSMEVQGKECVMEVQKSRAVQAQAYAVAGMCTTTAGQDYVGGEDSTSTTSSLSMHHSLRIVTFSLLCVVTAIIGDLEAVSVSGADPTECCRYSTAEGGLRRHVLVVNAI